MKNLFFIVCISCFTTLSSCNNGNGKPQNDTKNTNDESVNKAGNYNFDFLENFVLENREAKGLEVFYVPKDTALAMVDTFKTNYVKQGGKYIKAFDTTYWLSVCTINALSDYFKANTKYDGMRIYFASDINDDANLPGEEFKRNTKIKIFATQKRETVPNDKVSIHKDDDLGVKLPVTCTEAHFFKTKKDVLNEVNSFESYYHKSPKLNDNKERVLSKSIWIDTTVVKFLSKMVSSNDNLVDGVTIITASYRGKGWENKPKYTLSKQSTVLMVPSKKGNAEHTPDWNILTAFFRYIDDKSREKGMPFFGGFNKGELCPQVCN